MFSSQDLQRGCFRGSDSRTRSVASSLSQENANEALRSLVARYSEWPGRFILHSLLNNRGSNPQCYPGFIHHVSYPELGVIRHTVSTSNAHAWYDTVISKAAFRRSVDEMKDQGETRATTRCK